MDIERLTAFFMWCTVINGGMLALWAVMCLCAMDFVYRIHSKWFPMPRETFNVVMYLFLGLFKIFFLFFNLVPYVAILVLG